MEPAKQTITFPHRVVYATKGFLEKRGFRRVAFLPSIVGSSLGYHRIANRFLIDSGLGEWSASTR